MSKMVILTRKSGEITVKETVQLIDEDALVFAKDDIEKNTIALGVSASAFMENGFVLFEDEMGLFGIDPKDIIKIEDV